MQGMQTYFISYIHIIFASQGITIHSSPLQQL